MTSNVADTGLAVLGTALSTLKTLKGADSLVSYTQAARVEPIVLLDADCLYSEMTPDVMQTLLSIFSAYYLQAWDLSANIGGVEVLKTLEKLNPSRDMLNNVSALEAVYDAPSEDKLPSFNVSIKPRLALESDKDVEQVRDLVNLSVGKLLQVEIKTDAGTTDDGKTKVKVIKIPVAVRLMVNSIPTQSLVTMLSTGSKDTSAKERYHQWKAGEIEFFRDLVMCQDLIDEHKKVLMDDKTGMMDIILNRRTGNMISSILSQNLSVATASNIAVISSDTATQLEAHIGKPLSNFQARQKIFEKTYLMLLAVIHKDWGRVTFYTRGIAETTSASAADLRGGNKGSGPDVGDILAAYKAGSSPSL